MTLLGRGVLAIWNGITDGVEEEFLKWHVHEHIRDRVVLPGFLRGRRYVSIDGDPQFFNFYESETVADLSSDSYRAELNRPTPWTQKVVRHFTHTSRTACEVAFTAGCGEGAVIETIRLSSRLPREEFLSRLGGTLLSRVAGEQKIVGVHLLQGQTQPQGDLTEENRLRGGADEAVAWVILVEAVDQATIQTLRAGLLSDDQLTRHGADAGMQRGAYALQFALAKPELLAAGGIR